MMSNLFLIIIFVFLFLYFSFCFIRNLTTDQKKNISFGNLIPTEKENNNPDINTKNWDLHKIRLIKFGRSQYKGLTFFVSSEDRIYYLSKEGNKVYC